MDIKTRETLGKAIFNAVKKEITAIKRWNEEYTGEKGHYANRRREQTAVILTGRRLGWVGAENDCYQIRVGERWHDAPVLADNITNFYDLREVFGEVEKLLNAQRKVKGWGNLKVVHDDVVFEFGEGYWSRKTLTYPAKITLCEKPCKEYGSLQAYLNKYGKSRYGAVNLGNFELFRSSMGGKRGRLWDEYGDREYLDNKPKTCARLLEELRAHRGSKDTMLCERGKEDWIDPIDKAYSERHEVECEGERRGYLKVTIMTPAGKVKHETKIY